MRPTITETIPDLQIGDRIAWPGYESAIVETVLQGGVFGVRLPSGETRAIRNDSTVTVLERQMA